MCKIIVLVIAGLFMLFLTGAAVTYWRLNYAPDRGELLADIKAELSAWRGPDASTDIVVAVVKDGQSRFISYGPNKATERTLFQVGSISKVFTALLLQRLVDAGELHMDDSLGELIGARYQLAPDAADVTLYQLVTHTSGFPTTPKPIEDEVLRRVGGMANLLQDPYNQLNRDEVLAYLADPVAKAKPGRVEYSNYGMGLLAHVIELRTGKSYAVLLDELIFTPLGMEDSHGGLPESVERRLIQGHDAGGKPVAPWRFSSLGGAGSITSNTHDLVRFIEANLDKTSPLAASLARQRLAQPSGQAAIGWMLPTFFDRFEGNGSIVWHNGAVNGYFAYIAIDPVGNSGVVVLTNQHEDITALGGAMARLVRTQSW